MDYTSSVLTGANVCHIETLTITNENVTLKRNKDAFGLFTTTTTVPRKRIQRITVNSNILGADFYIHCYGDTAVNNVVIHGEGFSKNDVKLIKQTLIG